MELTPEIEQLIADKAKELADEKAKEIIEQITKENNEKIEKITTAHAAEIKTYKDSITAIISGKNEEKSQKTKMELLVDEINARRNSNKIK